MKILFCTNAFQHVTNGPVRFANIILEINALFPQHQLRILTEDITPDRLAQTPHVYRLSLHIPRLFKPLGQVLRWFIYYREIKKIEQQYDFDVLVFINSFNGLWASLVSEKPTVGMINDEKNMLATWQNFELKPLWFKRFMFQQFERWSARRHRLVIANSFFLQSRIIKTYQLPPQKVTKLYKSIPLTNINFDPQRAFGNPVKILFVKADYLVGNLPVLAQALKTLPQYQFLLTVVGPESWFEAHLRSLFINIPNLTLYYAGPQPQERVFEYMGSHDIFCVPSYTEAFGVANIEALAHGITVISSEVGGIPEVLDHGQNGWLVAPNIPNALAEAIAECIENEPERLKRAQNGRKFIEKFSKTEMLQEFIAQLEKITNRHSLNQSFTTH